MFVKPQENATLFKYLTFAKLVNSGSKFNTADSYSLQRFYQHSAKLQAYNRKCNFYQSGHRS